MQIARRWNNQNEAPERIDQEEREKFQKKFRLLEETTTWTSQWIQQKEFQELPLANLFGEHCRCAIMGPVKAAASPGADVMQRSMQHDIVYPYAQEMHSPPAQANPKRHF